MKKWLIVVISLMCLAPTVFASNWGLGLRAGAAQNDPRDMKDAYNDYFAPRERTWNPAVVGLEVLHEWDLNSESNKLGIKIGADVYGQNKIDLGPGMVKATETTYAIPLTVYYKNDNGERNLSWFAGVGFTWIRSEIKMDVWGFGRDKYSESKIFPHITVGTEYRFNSVVALGFDLKYNIDAKVTQDADILSDRSGIGGAITARFYF